MRHIFIHRSVWALTKPSARKGMIVAANLLGRETIVHTYRYVCRKVGGQDMIFVLLEGQLCRPVPTSEDRNRIQAAAQRAGIPGILVLVWHVPHGFRYLGPAAWASAFESLTWEALLSAADELLLA